MKKSFDIQGVVSRFSGTGGWFYVSVPQKYNTYLRERRPAWGMFPIKVKVGNTSWKTKLMMKKGGGFFVALNKEVREKENIAKGKQIKVDVFLIGG